MKLCTMNQVWCTISTSGFSFDRVLNKTDLRHFPGAKLLLGLDRDPHGVEILGKVAQGRGMDDGVDRRKRPFA